MEGIKPPVKTTLTCNGLSDWFGSFLLSPEQYVSFEPKPAFLDITTET